MNLGLLGEASARGSRACCYLQERDDKWAQWEVGGLLKLGMKLLNGQCRVLRGENHHASAQAPSTQPDRRPEGWARPSVPASPLSRLILCGHAAPLTTSPSTSVRTRSPISGEMSLPNCCRVVRKRLSLLSCRAPQAGGRCWVDSEAVDEVAGPLLKPLGVDGVPLMAVGEWLLPFITVGRWGEGREEHSREPESLPRVAGMPWEHHTLSGRAISGLERWSLAPGLSEWGLLGQTLHTPGGTPGVHLPPSQAAQCLWGTDRGASPL